MAWQVNGESRRRTPGEQLSYIQGFKAATGMAVQYTAEGKPLDKVLAVSAMLEQCAIQDDADADPDR